MPAHTCLVVTPWLPGPLPASCLAADYRFDVSKLEPVVAAPHSPDNRKLARECHDVKIDRGAWPPADLPRCWQRSCARELSQNAVVVGTSALGG